MRCVCEVRVCSLYVHSSSHARVLRRTTAAALWVTQHLAECEETKLINEERQSSADLTCGVCMDKCVALIRL